jgi:hypothetical protein
VVNNNILYKLFKGSFTKGVCMEYVIAVFLNRSHSQLFSKILHSKGVPNNLISTPRDLGVSCGLSVKFNIIQLSKVKQILNCGSYSTFKNFYKIVQISNNKTIYIKV